ncbi:hypothetical protein [Dyella telluris]|uniref:Antitoxin Xre/MbcA/ParS-like toxin-binding domain-containing protein n=1 Tax=Dyella telluris TaxID=2763498 RepID=A0A7G8Q8Y6_9GAMM|nr:hypothetical protein [Dyella telluris]QNK03244.1 hypothetical protein H8F01_09120 [Dyella telluris]
MIYRTLGGARDDAPMDDQRRRGSVEFAEFLADISHPGTGEILVSQLSSWFNQTEHDFFEKWHARQDKLPWTIFVDQVLAVLDVVQDETCDMGVTIDWFLNKHLPTFGMQTPYEVVLEGRGRSLALAVIARAVPVP